MENRKLKNKEKRKKKWKNNNNSRVKKKQLRQEYLSMANVKLMRKKEKH